MHAQVGPKFPPLNSGEGPLDYQEVKGRLDEGMAWLAKLYCDTMNVSGGAVHFGSRGWW
jgi:formate C-acetyltransferase